jgi:hypothetical protein
VIPEWERNVLKEWFVTEAIGVFHVKELGVFNSYYLLQGMQEAYY